RRPARFPLLRGRRSDGWRGDARLEHPGTRHEQGAVRSAHGRGGTPTGCRGSAHHREVGGDQRGAQGCVRLRQVQGDRLTRTTDKEETMSDITEKATEV